MTTNKTILVGTIGRGAPVVTVCEADLRVIEHQGHRVVTLAMVDAVHHRARGTARKRFNDNRAHLIQGEDFVKMSASEFRTRFPGAISLRATSDVTLMFETGYLMLVKSFTDDLAWQVQRTLVKTYFQHQPATLKIGYAVGKNDTLTKAEQDQRRNTLTDAAQRLPLEERGEFLVRGWSKLKCHFRLGKGRPTATSRAGSSLRR